MVKNDKKVLVVEDENSLRSILSDTLKKEGYEVLEAKNGSEGLKLALKDHPDLILLDIIMPKMDGIEMLKKLRMDEWGRTANIIILSVVQSAEKVNEAMKSQVFDFWVKSDWKLTDIVGEVKKRLK